MPINCVSVDSLLIQVAKTNIFGIGAKKASVCTTIASFLLLASRFTTFWLRHVKKSKF